MWCYFRLQTVTMINIMYLYYKAIGTGEAGEALASPVFKLGVHRPKQLDYEIAFACSVCLFVCLLGHFTLCYDWLNKF